MKTMKNQSKKTYCSPRTHIIMAEGGCLLAASGSSGNLNTSQGMEAGSSAANTFAFGFFE